MRTPRRFLLLLAFGLAAGATGLARGQAVVTFDNLSTAPFYDADVTTRLAGTNYSAALYVGSPDSPLESWIQLGGSASFLSNGCFNGGNRTLPACFPAGSLVGAQVRFWERAFGSTFESAGRNGGKIGVSLPMVIVSPGPDQAAPLTDLESGVLVPVLALSRGLPGIVTASSTVSNSTQLASLCGVSVGLNRWFYVTSPTSGEAVLTTAGSAIDTVMSAFEGNIYSLNTLTNITCNDDCAAGATASEVRFPVEANKLYLICVAGKNGASGTIQFNYFLATRLLMLRSQWGGTELSWPADATNSVVEVTTNSPEATGWQVLTNRPMILFNRRVLILDCPTPRATYRLRVDVPR